MSHEASCLLIWSMNCGFDRFDHPRLLDNNPNVFPDKQPNLAK